MKNKFEKLGKILNKQAQHAITGGQQDDEDLNDGRKTDPETCMRTVWGVSYVHLIPIPIRKIEVYEC
ncbi:MULTISPECIES: hypothetical protein [unclassified Tenacibaculum]|uniref:hypothetical protein n=1 Tax=unclassified Tenacibaculum TaxID=2635139 RepID=UPI001F44AD2D|nr:MULTISPECIES: hypothetical protein [unclassified Tenacibaculum]MCF2875400.1 hypothetical protein [Tenacibaculum sp. Cn5-1]MCF2935476.1 hypothetical protein [Tenacibaculum sp. Cn5-34]MCG7512036.1 hypothetical protein [Tenacibaculum sp. Cn5-46]